MILIDAYYSTAPTTHTISLAHFLHSWTSVAAGSLRMGTEGTGSLECSIEIFLSVLFLQTEAAATEKNAREQAYQGEEEDAS
jgi:hypothetical protein